MFLLLTLTGYMDFSVYEISLWGGLLSVLSVLRESFHCWSWGRPLLRFHLSLHSTFSSICWKTGSFQQHKIIACIYTHMYVYAYTHTHSESLYAIPLSNKAVQVLATILAVLAVSTPCSLNVKFHVRWWICDKYLEDLANTLLGKLVDVMFIVIFSL